MYYYFFNIKYIEKIYYDCIYFKLKYQIKFYNTKTFIRFEKLTKQS